MPSQFLNPHVRGGIETATGFNTFTGRSYPANMIPDIFYKSTVGGYPLTKLIQSEISPQYQTGPVQGSPLKQPVYLPASSKTQARVQAAEAFLLGGARKRDLNLARAGGRPGAAWPLLLPRVLAARLPVAARRPPWPAPLACVPDR
jgi:hypothetical protein